MPPPLSSQPPRLRSGADRHVLVIETGNCILYKLYGAYPQNGGASWEFDGDGRGDVLWRHAGSGANYLWTLNGLAVTLQGYLPSVADTGWQPVK